MADKTIKTRIINKHDTSTNWSKAVNFIPKKGEIIIYDDLRKMKIGDGVTVVSALPFVEQDISYPLEVTQNGEYTPEGDKLFNHVSVNIKSYPFVVTGAGTYNPKEGYLFDSVTVPDITLERAFKSIGYTEIPEGFNASIEYSKKLASKWDPSKTSVSIFTNDKKLVYAPYIDTSNVTNMSNMFYNCSALAAIPAFNTSNATNMNGMFETCSSLITIPLLDTSNVTNMDSMFTRCYKLTSILMTGTKCSFSISDTALGHDALVTLLNNLGTANSGATLTMGSSKLALLSDEEKKIATDKGWILA